MWCRVWILFFWFSKCNYLHLSHAAFRFSVQGDSQTATTCTYLISLNCNYLHFGNCWTSITLYCFRRHTENQSLKVQLLALILAASIWVGVLFMRSPLEKSFLFTGWHHFTIKLEFLNCNYLHFALGHLNCNYLHFALEFPNCNYLHLFSGKIFFDKCTR